MNTPETRLEVAVARRIAAGLTATEVIEAADRIIIEAGGSLDDDAPEIRDEVAAIAWHLDPRPDEVAAILEAHQATDEHFDAGRLRAAPEPSPLRVVERLDECGMRTPGWVEGRWVTLADGQAWALPPIHANWGPRTLLDGTIDPMHPHGVPAEVLGGVAMLHAALQRRGAMQLGHLALFKIARGLLAENYWLTADQRKGLMPYDVTSPCWAVEAAAFGVDDVHRIVAAVAFHVKPFLDEYRAHLGLVVQAA